MLRIFLLLYFVFLSNNLVSLEKIEDIITCLKGTDCDEFTDIDNYTETFDENGLTSNNFPNVTVNITQSTLSINLINITQTPEYETTTTAASIIVHKFDLEINNHSIYKKQSDICECDLTVASCDINCCCDMDCKDHHLKVFTHCKDYHTELYDSRYCYSRNFIERNNTPFILEKLANNLFCILYDNLPPMYSVSNNLVINNQKDLWSEINKDMPKWKFEHHQSMFMYNVTSIYKEGDFVWKLQNNYIRPLELLQTGFTGKCSFKKMIKYLNKWKDSCMQIELTDANQFLFPSTYNNFTIIKSLHLFNQTYILPSDQSCPKNICLSPISHYCRNSWNTCNNTEILGSCSKGVCYNIIKGVKYLISHNGTFGIDNITIHFLIGNVSQQFYQSFEVSYEWNDQDKRIIFDRSGNPGYIHGKPLIIGTIKTNKTNNIELRYISFNKTKSFLTLPLGQKNRECSQTNRYTIVFGEDIKVKCSLTLNTTIFTTTSCIELHNKTLHLLMEDTLLNVTQADQYAIHISKLGNFTNNNTSEWIKIVLDRVPQHVITGQILNDWIRCSGLITSIKYDILYSVSSKSESLTNYDILGVGVTFSEETDLSWSKCVMKNCTNVLQIDITSFVTFHDISKPSRYYFAGGPNLDLTLPCNGPLVIDLYLIKIVVEVNCRGKSTKKDSCNPYYLNKTLQKHNLPKHLLLSSYDQL
ncbi:tectonic-3-like [Polistes fuscatus]|uniref:tectonic-3-like n=1 Tax=Polistes fuscatus TaxID=30207 RepID=UPI001CA9F507|nr:tectonic-3-like [Polistes fuscatus]